VVIKGQGENLKFKRQKSKIKVKSIKMSKGEVLGFTQ
jgi:hypothetical protein